MKLRVAAVTAIFLTSSCGLFTTKEPYKRWNVTISYVEENDAVHVEPTRLTVHGPRGVIRVNNSTNIKRGFSIEDLGVAVEINRDRSARLDVTGVEDGKRYVFRDQLHRGGLRGTLSVDYIRQY